MSFFFGNEIATKLGYSNHRDAINRHIDSEDKGVVKHDTLGGKQSMTIINESGLYSLILSSKLESAKRFKHWVTREVLPSIRKNGGYIKNQENLTSKEKSFDFKVADFSIVSKDSEGEKHYTNISVYGKLSEEAENSVKVIL